ncbi:GntR family transcriptional regulator [Streptomyces monticola]|uniref:GntR family transcriptional regulator n=1 Tax=Streptomyces monticola TaxID=2666263 RepID=A0ABW2JQC4_9ACTN
MNEAPGGATAGLLDTTAIAHYHHVPAATAQFVRRAAHTRLHHEYRTVCQPKSPGSAAERETSVPPAGCRGDAAPRASTGSGYRAVACDLRERIARGEITGMLPSRTRLAVHYATSRSTIKRAVEELAAQGLLAPHGSAGTQVLRTPV